MPLFVYLRYWFGQNGMYLNDRLKQGDAISSGDNTIRGNYCGTPPGRSVFNSSGFGSPLGTTYDTRSCYKSDYPWQAMLLDLATRNPQLTICSKIRIYGNLNICLKILYMYRESNGQLPYVWVLVFLDNVSRQLTSNQRRVEFPAVENEDYRPISNIGCTKSQNSNVSRLVLQLSLSNLLKPCVKLRMNM